MMAVSSETMTELVGEMKQAWEFSGTVRRMTPEGVLTVQPVMLVTAYVFDIMVDIFIGFWNGG